MRFKEFVEQWNDAPTTDFPATHNPIPQGTTRRMTTASDSQDKINPYFANFKRWYDFNRGKWSEVEQAAQSNTEINRLLIGIRRHFADHFGDVKSQGPFGDQLQAAVTKLNPRHGHPDPMQKRANYGSASPVKQQAMSTTTSGGSSQMQQALGNDHTVRMLSATLDNHALRIGNIEKKMGFNASPSP
jgi:hypothetical protein